MTNQVQKSKDELAVFEEKLSPLFELIYVLVKNTKKYLEVYADDVKVVHLPQYKAVIDKLKELEDTFAEIYWGDYKNDLGSNMDASATKNTNSPVAPPVGPATSSPKDKPKLVIPPGSPVAAPNSPVAAPNTGTSSSGSYNPSQNLAAKNAQSSTVNPGPKDMTSSTVKQPANNQTVSQGKNTELLNNSSIPSTHIERDDLSASSTAPSAPQVGNVNPGNGQSNNTTLDTKTSMARGNSANDGKSIDAKTKDMNALLQQLEYLKKKSDVLHKDIDTKSDSGVTSSAQNPVTNVTSTNQPTAKDNTIGAVQTSNAPIQTSAQNSNQTSKQTAVQTPKQTSNQIPTQLTQGGSSTVQDSVTSKTNVDNNVQSTQSVKGDMSADDDAELQKILAELRKLKN